MSTDSTAEWDIRCDLAAAYRLIAHFGMDDVISTHLSARLPGKEHRFLINPYGLMFDEITASSLIVIDPEGRALADEDEAVVNNAGFTIHSAVHMSRDDAMCVMHTHTVSGMAVAAQKEGLLPLNQKSMSFYGGVSYHDYEGYSVDLEERERLARNLGTNDVMILRNHGLLTVGRTVGEAFLNMYQLDVACQVQVAAVRGGRMLTVPSNDTAAHTAKQFKQNRYNQSPRPWLALKRRLDRICPEYAS